MFTGNKCKWTSLILSIAFMLFGLSTAEAKSSAGSSKKKPAKTKAASKKTKKVKIDADDPKAFTKAILLEKEGVDYEVVDQKAIAQKKEVERQAKEAEKQAKEAKDYFDFSTMLIPITHEALIGSPYGVRDHRLHRGVDVAVIKDEPVVAALPGVVVTSAYNKGGYGHYVIIEHENGIQTLYGHLSERLVNVDDQLFPGDIVGLAGNTGKSSSAHLHFEIRYGEVNIDPTKVIDFPHWKLRDGVEKFSKKKAIKDHQRIQQKLKTVKYYTVKKGDTLTSIAKYFNISVDALCRLNNLKKNSKLRIGQKLKGCR